MDLKHCTAVLLVKDAKKAKDFYVDILGLTVVANFGDLNFMFKEGFALWQPMEENIIPRILGSSNIFNKENASRFELCFETENLVKVYNTLKSHNVKFLHEVNEELWGQRTIRFYDLDGHLIEAGEAMPIFLQRIYEEEKSVEAAARRTYMDAEMIKQILNL